MYLTVNYKKFRFAFEKRSLYSHRLKWNKNLNNSICGTYTSIYLEIPKFRIWINLLREKLLWAWWITLYKSIYPYLCIYCIRHYRTICHRITTWNSFRYVSYNIIYIFIIYIKIYKKYSIGANLPPIVVVVAPPPGGERRNFLTINQPPEAGHFISFGRRKLTYYIYYIIIYLRPNDYRGAAKYLYVSTLGTWNHQSTYDNII